MSDVFFVETTSNKSLEKLLASIDFNFIDDNDFVALKVHFGENGNNTYIQLEQIYPVIKHLKKTKSKVFITDTNTIYTGSRSNAVDHIILANNHGFIYNKTNIPIIIADGLKGNDFVEVEINLNYFKKAKIASGIYYANSLICCTHFKGHMLFGFGGSIKNLGMGCASRSGKYILHNCLKPIVKSERCTSCLRCISNCPQNSIKFDKEKKKIFIIEEQCVGCGECIHICKNKVFRIPWDASFKEVQEKTVEYSLATIKNKSGKTLFLNFLDKITKDCDCIPTKQKPVLDNIGILASFDPVAIDKASLDIVNEHYKVTQNKSDIFKDLWPEVEYNYQLDYAKKIGLGSLNYRLLKI